MFISSVKQSDSIIHNYMCIYRHVSVPSRFSHVSLWSYGLQSTMLLGPWGFSRQEYWSGLPCPPPPGDLPDPGMEPRSLTSPALASGFFTTCATWEAQSLCVCVYIYIYICVCVCVCVCTYICVCVCIYIYIFLFIFFSIMICHRILPVVPHAIQYRDFVICQ